VVAFDLTPDMPPTTTTTTTTTAAAASRTTSTTPPPPSHVLTVGEMGPVFEFKSKRTGNPKVLNLHGLRHLLVIVLSMPLWMIGLEVVHALGDAFPGFDDDRGKFDAVGKVWCRAYLGATGCYPSVGGDVGRLSVEKGGVAGAGGGGGPCLFVANHASFLDIAVICCALGPTFKFIAKDSLEKFPGVGRQLVGVSRARGSYGYPVRSVFLFRLPFAPTEWEKFRVVRIHLTPSSLCAPSSRHVY